MVTKIRKYSEVPVQLTLTDLAKIIEDAAYSICTVYRPYNTKDAGVWIFIDDYDADRRISIQWDLGFGRNRIRRVVLHGYDKERNCWQHGGPELEIELKNNRGRKRLMEAMQSLTKNLLMPNPTIHTVYNR